MLSLIGNVCSKTFNLFLEVKNWNTCILWICQQCFQKSNKLDLIDFMIWLRFLDIKIEHFYFQHLESAPKEILGDFPRFTREAAAALVFKTEAKHKGQLWRWDARSLEKSGILFSIFMFSQSNELFLLLLEISHIDCWNVHKVILKEDLIAWQIALRSTKSCNLSLSILFVEWPSFML